MGDEVVYRAATVAEVCLVAVELVERFAGDPVLPGVRAGVAGGRLLLRDDDCFGPVVNLAARATEAAAPGAVVVASLEPLDPLAGLHTTVLPPAELAGFDGPAARAAVTRD